MVREEDVKSIPRTQSYGYSFDDYQKDAATTATYPDRGGLLGLAYLTCGLTGEIGEIAGKLFPYLNNDNVDENLSTEITKEIGDVLWFFTEICTHFNVLLSSVANSIDFWEYQIYINIVETYNGWSDKLELAAIMSAITGAGGEVSGKIAKGFRDDHCNFYSDRIKLITNKMQSLLFWISKLCTFFNIQFNDVAIINSEKLKDRMARGVLGGDGDNR